jgi:hypothetical protein
MSSHFYYGVYLPSIGRKVYFKELTIRQLKAIIKTILNADDVALSICFNDVIKDNCKEDISALALTSIDRFIILVNMRIISIGATQKVQVTCEETKKQFSYTIDYNKITDQLESINLDGNIVKEYGPITIEYGIPLASRHYQIPNDISRYDVVAKAIRRVKIQHTEFGLADLDFYSLTQLIEKLPKNVSEDILLYLETQENKINQVKYILVTNPYTEKVIEQSMSLNDNVIMKILTLAFKEDLHTLYKSIYYMVHALHFDPNYVEELTVNEKQLHWTFYLADQKEKQKDSKQTTPGLPVKDSTNVFMDEMNR